MHLALSDAKRRIVGVKQVLRALELGEVAEVYLAADAEEKILAPLRMRADALGVPVREARSMAHLGNACCIEVGAAAAALRKPQGGA